MVQIKREGYEYQRFGNGFVRRKVDSTDDWQETPLDDIDASVLNAFQNAEERRRDRLRRGAAGGVNIHRSKQNEDIASELGLADADDLAERLVGRRGGGTNTRVSEERFDAIAETLGLTPQEIRDRFAGRF